MKKTNLFLGILAMALVLTMAACGGDDEDSENGGNKVIAPALIGKWEIQSVSFSGITTEIIAGYEFTLTTYKYFLNGVLFQQSSEIYTEGNRMYLSSGGIQTDLDMAWEVSGDTLTITRTQLNSVIVCKKVTVFSWE